MSIGVILIRWKLFIGLSILLFVIASVTFNLNVITITGIIVINGYGAVTISRKLIQLSFARSYIRSSRYVTRQPLVLAASSLYPQHAKQIKKLLHSQDQWVDFRKRFISSISISEYSGKLAWKKIYAATYPEAAPVGIVVPTYKTKWTQLHRLVKDIAIPISGMPGLGTITAIDGTVHTVSAYTLVSITATPIAESAIKIDFGNG